MASVPNVVSGHYARSRPRHRFIWDGSVPDHRFPRRVRVVAIHRPELLDRFSPRSFSYTMPVG